MVLGADEREAVAEFEQERLEPGHQCGFKVSLGDALRGVGQLGRGVGQVVEQNGDIPPRKLCNKLLHDFLGVSPQ